MRDQPSRLVSFCVWGAAGGITKKVKSRPALGVVNPRSRWTRLSADLLGARAEKVPSTSALPGCVSLPSPAEPSRLYESRGETRPPTVGLRRAFF